MNGRTIFCSVHTMPGFSLNMYHLILGIAKCTSFRHFWFCQTVLGLSIFGESGLVPIGQPYFCLCVGLDFRYEVSSHPLLVWWQDNILCGPHHQSFLNMALFNSRDWYTPLVLTIWICQILSGLRIFGESGLASLGQPHFQIWSQLASTSGMNSRMIFCAIHTSPAFP